ncbi:protein-arginine deiminase type-4-like [Gracilinanus agilis]|uniref:protein-arginine deiminase type-4-like n=1 Tax=Gracilinanus agilis TaxID=191870 RepID=UPI001CFE2960|nr:protein-arginine deiminase type-4-like [Gracilinanus agilis]
MASWHGDLVSWHGKLVSWKATIENWQAPENESEAHLEAPRKMFPVSVERPIKTVCPTGSVVYIDVMGFAPEGYKTFEAQNSERVTIDVIGTKFNYGFTGHPSRWYLKPSAYVVLLALAPSSRMFSDWVKITYFKGGEEHSSCVAEMNITCVTVSLIADPYMEKTKKMSKTKTYKEKNQTCWQGPILLVNCSSKNQYPPVEDDCGKSELSQKVAPFYGYVIHERGDDNDLDATGFLEVSPPVTAHGISYPLGRILIGSGSLPRENVPEVNQRLLRFIQAQNIQHPLELFSEWLLEGNVKDFLTFVPANNRKGFRLLLASPSACYELFKREQNLGHGSASLLEGVDKSVLYHSERQKMTINEILANKKLWEQNDYVETCIAWNRRVLKEELGLSEKDIIDIPQLFNLGWINEPSTQKKVLRAGHFFPNMLNMIVLGTYLGIPKPFGPIINGACCVEKRVQDLLEPLGLHCIFMEEFLGHQEEWRDAYYWFNVRREPLSFKWWNFVI